MLKFAWSPNNSTLAGKDTLFHTGLTIVDSVDTIILMGLGAEYADAREWIANSLDFNQDLKVNMFEATIRLLGGMLAAYHLTQDQLYLDKAVS